MDPYKHHTLATLEERRRAVLSEFKTEKNRKRQADLAAEFNNLTAAMREKSA